jgi:hypothetical protein
MVRSCKQITTSGIIKRALTLRYNDRRDKADHEDAGLKILQIPQQTHSADTPYGIVTYSPSPLYVVRHPETITVTQTG